MRITAVTPIPVTFPLGREPMSFCFVRVETDDELVGYGEACDSYGCTYAGLVAEVIAQAFAPLLVGTELAAAEPAVARLRDATRRRLGDQWMAVHARSAVEIALQDLLARHAGISLAARLGQVRDRVGVYASGTFLEEGDAEFHLALLQPLLERGVRRVKVRIGPDWTADLATLRNLRGRLPADVEVLVDGSETFTLPTALEIADRLAGLGVRWFEEPVPQQARAAIAALCARSPVPIAYGEHHFGRADALEALAAGVQVLQPDAATCGGVAVARECAELAAPYGARVVPHVCAGPIALAANVAVAASVPAIRAIEYPVHLLPAWEALGTAGSLGSDAIADGMLAVPAGPGLGVAVDEGVAAAHPYRVPGARVSGTVGGLPDRFCGDV